MRSPISKLEPSPAGHSAQVLTNVVAQPAATASMDRPGPEPIEASAPEESLLAAFDESSVPPESITRVPLEPSPLDKLASLSGLNKAPGMVVESPTPQWVLSTALNSLPAIQGTPLGDEIRAALVEARGDRLMLVDSHPDFRDPMMALMDAPGIKGTPMAEGIQVVIDRYFTADGARYKGLLCPYARDLEDLFVNPREMNQGEPGLYFHTKDRNGEFAAIRVDLHPDVRDQLKEAMWGDQYRFSLEAIHHPDSDETLVVAKTDVILASRWIACLDPESVWSAIERTKPVGEEAVPKQPRPTPDSSDGARIRGAEILLTKDVLDVLSTAVVEGRTLKITAGQLPKKLYARVDEALNAIGGEWNRQKGGHVFQDDPACVLAEALEKGSVTDPVRLYQFYPTPQEISRELVNLACIEAHHRVLEPSGGDGAILQQLHGAVAVVDTCEINPDLHAKLVDQSGVNVVGSDFLAYNPGPVYDRIVANPPFTRQQDILHANHMLDLLKPGGRLVVVLSGATSYRDDRRTCEFKDRLERECPGFEFKALPSGAFAASGTMVSAVVLTANKSHLPALDAAPDPFLATG